MKVVFFMHFYTDIQKIIFSMDIKDRINYVKKIDIETWENLSKGITKISFQEKVNKILLEFYTYI